MVGTYERKISLRRMLIAFFLTTAVFLVGLLVGYTLTVGRTSYLEDISYKQRLDYESLQLQSLFLDINSDNKTCEGFDNILESSLNDVIGAQRKVDSYMLDSGKKAYDDLKRDYTLAEVRYWLLNQKIRSSCPRNNVALLYFYSNTDCFDCGPQGTILTYLKEKLKDKLLVFSIDSDLASEPMVSVIKKRYNITVTPSIIIEDELFTGFLSKENIIKELCLYYDNNVDICS